MPGMKALCHVFTAMMKTFGDFAEYAPGFFKYASTVSVGARTHPDPRTRQLCKLFLASAMMAQPCYSLESWDWDQLFLDRDGTNFVQQACDLYSFEGCHNFLLREQGTWGASSRRLFPSH